MGQYDKGPTRVIVRFISIGIIQDINNDIEGDVKISYIEDMSPNMSEGEESLENLVEGFSVRGLFRSLKIALSCIYGIVWACSLSPDDLEKARQELKAEMKKYWSQ